MATLSSEDRTMREIKFRAWDTEEKAMLYPESEPEYVWLWAQHEDELFIGLRGQAYLWNSDREYHKYCFNVILMQCTGLRDKNGVGIYEGDVVNLGTIAEVVWSGTVVQRQGCWCVKTVSAAGVIHPVLAKFIIEVIGNIYENPELIDGQS